MHAPLVEDPLPTDATVVFAEGYSSEPLTEEQFYREREAERRREAEDRRQKAEDRRRQAERVQRCRAKRAQVKRGRGGACNRQGGCRAYHQYLLQFYADHPCN